jgi:hypothetical protein
MLVTLAEEFVSAYERWLEHALVDVVLVAPSASREARQRTPVRMSPRRRRPRPSWRSRAAD